MADVLIAAALRDLLPDDVLPGHAVEWLDEGAPVPEGQFAAIVPLLTRRIGAAELDRLPGLRVVANCAVGYDNVDLAAAAARGVVVTNTPDVLTDAVADLTWALILACARRLAEGDALVRSGRWMGWHPTQLLGLELRGAAIGLIGAGRIGSAVAHRALAFGARVLYTSRSPRPDLERETGARRLALDALLAESDVVSLHLPLTPETRGLLGERELALIKPGGILVNTSRGGLVDEMALAEELERGRLGAAGLDVYEGEPHLKPRLLAAPRLMLLPHLGSATWRARRAMAALAVENVRRVLAGEPALTPVG